MNIRKLFAALLCLVYVYTNQLGIHAFAMHGEAEQSDINVITHKDCWHHDNHNTKKDNDDSSMDCLTQWKNASSSYSNSTIDTPFIARDVNLTTFLFIDKKVIDQYYYSIHDPGWWIHWNFSKFLDDLYGKGIVMID